MAKLTVKQLWARFTQLKAERSTWEQHWQELADYILPRRNDINTEYTQGAKRNLQLLDNTAMQSNELLAGALHGLLTNPTTQWFELTTGDDALDDNDEVRLWLQKTSRKLLNLFNNSNFQTEVHEMYLDLTCLGTAAMTIEEDVDFVVRFSTKHIKETYVSENSRGMIDEVYRVFKWNARKIVEEFGEDLKGKLPKKVREAFEKGTEERFEILHAIYPRDIGNQKPGAMKFVSQYVMREEDFELAEAGFREFPAVIPRWTKASGETYGRSPGMNALPEAKTLNKMTETVMIGAQKTIDPPLMAPDDGFILPLITKPGGINYYRAGSTDRLEPIFNDARIDFGFQALAERRTRIREAFFVDQLQLNQGPQMTATEVLQRTEEKSRLLGPMLGRQQSEFLRPTIDRVYEIGNRRKVFDEPPQILRGKKIDVKYSSPIANAQMLSQGQNIMRTVEAASPFIQADQSVLDNINGDAALKKIARIYGAPQEILRSEREVKAIRDGRAKQAAELAKQQQQQTQVDNITKVVPAMAQAV